MPKISCANRDAKIEENLLVIDDPNKFSGIFAFLFSAGNIRDVASLYTIDAVLIGLDGMHYRGREAIATYWGNLRAHCRALRHVSRSAVVQSESALLLNDFQLLSQNTVVCAGLCVTVLQEDADKGWRSMIEYPVYADWHQLTEPTIEILDPCK